MAYIDHKPPVDLPDDHKVPDNDNILSIHNVHSRIIRLHYDLYRELMFGKSPLSRIQREMIAVAVSSENQCHY